MTTTEVYGMKAAIYRGIENIKIEEVSMPKCEDKGVIIRVNACAICGSDVRTYYKGTSYVKPNTIIGHEVVGTISEKGKDVGNLEIGDRVAVGPIIPCGKCYFCQRGQQYLCLHEEDFGGMHPGGFAEYMHIIGKAITYGSVCRVPQDLSSQEATLAEPLSSVYKAHELCNTKSGDVVVVIGAGPIGCMHVEIAKIRGVKKVIQSEISDQRLKFAQNFGADVLIDSNKSNLTEKVKEETENLGADIVICAAPSTRIVEEGLQLVKRGGILLLFAGLPKDNPIVGLNGNLIHYNDINVIGTIGYSPRHFVESLDLIHRKGINPSKYITGTISLEKLTDGIERVKNGEELKLIVTP